MYNICIYRPSKQYIHHLAFLEIAELLHYSILELKIKSTITYNNLNTRSDVKNIIFGAHHIKEGMISSIPKNTIIFNTEQIESIHEEFKKRILLLVNHGVELWDYSSYNLEFLFKTLKIKGKLFKIGYQKNLQRIQFKENKDIDVLFYGLLNDRRKHIINNLLNKNVKVKHLFGVYGKARDEWIAKSKLVLNLHMYESKIFEIIRVFYLLTNGVPVVSEIDNNTKFNNDYLDGIKKSKYKEIEKNIIHLLKNEDERSNLGKKGFEYISKYPQVNFTKSILGL